MCSHRKLDREPERSRLAYAFLAGAAWLVLAAPTRPAFAAGGAYAVDDAEVGKPGDCKVETWGSFADNRDRIGVVQPACVFDIFRPVELRGRFERG